MKHSAIHKPSVWNKHPVVDWNSSASCWTLTSCGWSKSFGCSYSRIPGIQHVDFSPRLGDTPSPAHGCQVNVILSKFGGGHVVAYLSYWDVGCAWSSREISTSNIHWPRMLGWMVVEDGEGEDWCLKGFMHMKIYIDRELITGNLAERVGDLVLGGQSPRMMLLKPTERMVIKFRQTLECLRSWSWLILSIICI